MAKKIILLFSAVFLFTAFAGQSSAKLLYHETVTIILDDGTQINLVLDDYGMPKPSKKGAMRKVDFARAMFKEAVAKHEKDFKRRWTPRTPQAYIATPAAEKKKNNFIAKNKNHLSGKYLWADSAKIQEKRYYYLPPPPRVAVGPDGKPQFLFIKFVTDKTEAEGGASGGILHFLAEYGLSAVQEKELEEKLAKKIKSAKLMGAVPMELGSEESSFKIISATLTDEGFTKSIVSSGKAPIMPGMKVAAAARLDQYGATLLAKTLEKPTSDISIEFDLAYTSFLPAFDGTITVDWQKFKSNIDDYKLKYEHKKKTKSSFDLGGTIKFVLSAGLWGSPTKKKTKHYYTTDEMHTVYDYLCEVGVIDIEWTEEIVDERLNMIREAFMKLFSNLFFDKTPEQMMDTGEEPEKGKAEIDKVKGEKYTVYKFTAKSEESFKKTSYHLRTNLPVKTPYQVVGNINGTWYRKLQGEYPECFDEINIDDPFFQRRKVIFNLDLDAVEIFDDTINYVTVEVRKKRKSGRDFTDSATIDKAYVTTKGISATLTYAKMREDDPGVFEYLTQWSIRGGKVYPEHPQWKKGEWEGVTLAPPIAPLNIDVEADLEELKANDIAAVTVKFKYHKFGKIYEDPKTVRLNVTKGEPLITRTVFHDRDNVKYDYKITFHHKRKGAIDRGWVQGREDAYIYCSIPDNLRKKEKSALY